MNIEHFSLKQLSLYPITQRLEIRCVNLDTGGIKTVKDIVYLEYYQKYLKYLKFLNTQGFNIYFFPKPIAAGRSVDFLLDDIKANTLETLKDDGMTPLYYLETSPSNYQAILRFDSNISNKEQYLATNRHLVEKYNADPGSIGTEHFFRLSGFTNRKEKYLKNGQYPFVRLSFTGNVIEGNLLPAIKFPERVTLTAPRPSALGKKPGDCKAYVKAIYANGKISEDMSRLDFKAAAYSFRKGFPCKEIKAAIRLYSPNLETRHAGESRLENYLNLTISKALGKQNETN